MSVTKEPSREGNRKSEMNSLTAAANQSLEDCRKRNQTELIQRWLTATTQLARD